MSSLVNMIKTSPADKRFPSQNQAAHCWNRYNEWVLCLKGTDGDEDACKGVRQMASSICPVEWVSAKPQPGTLHTTTSHVQIAARLIGVARKLCCARHLGVASAPSVSAV
mmetsp:Transcript_97162/g.278099  ORF Transcript_97162/g.278099 Transcript_97162/m.278099 type:complete len:110 (-) Transcript_97162:1812-2141(-)